MQLFLANRRPAPISRRDLQVRAQALAGHSVAELAAAFSQPLPPNSLRGKGFVGQLVERALGADPAAGPNPDFPSLQVELKTIPVTAKGRPLESTFCCSIHMASTDHANWEDSRLRRRLRCVLWVPVETVRQQPLWERRFGRACLWSPTAAQEAILRSDWEELVGAIGAGGSSHLQGHQGQVLQVRPKAAHSRIRTLAPGPDGPQAVLPLGFYLRPHFTAQILAERPSVAGLVSLDQCRGPLDAPR